MAGVCCFFSSLTHCGAAVCLGDERHVDAGGVPPLLSSDHGTDARRIQMLA